ncbi:unnamed protein product [Penicillium bialowiezense]
MPPKQTSSVESPTKGRGAIIKGTPSKSTPTKPGRCSTETIASRDLYFLWRAVQLAGGISIINKDALAREFGLNAKATQNRWYRLKARMEAIENNQANKKGSAAEEDDDKTEGAREESE